MVSSGLERVWKFERYFTGIRSHEGQIYCGHVSAANSCDGVSRRIFSGIKKGFGEQGRGRVWRQEWNGGNEDIQQPYVVHYVNDFDDIEGCGGLPW